ncbi:hypothetical protein RN001_005205 [Aquatica leii]|uniref:Serpin domain-containing protein n=1 Tax=Aquatica leii TaxID=1421715 RepID=A0AAN7PJI0_9COLE|nr:hypothetical protein RN001_005205 [Aquatica leii]
MKIYVCLLSLFLIILQVHAKCGLLCEFAIANKKFTADVYEHAINQQEGNFLICPLSVQIIMGLVRFGARGNTASELTLHINKSNEEIGNMFIQLTDNLRNSSKVILTSANSIFLSNKYVINKDYNKVANIVFKATVNNVDFTKPKVAIDYINAWVEENTHNKIKNVLSKNSVSVDTAALLINTMYFHGNWIYQFDPHSTHKSKFYVNKHRTVDVDMMATDEYYNYYDDKKLNAQFIEFPFEGGDITMTIILPKERFGLFNLETQIFDILAVPQYQREKVEVFIPKFQVESEINIKSILQAMGVKSAFNRNADFSEISDSQPPLIIDNIVQKTFLEINEKGATAAASTAVVMTTLSLPWHTFHANHPFLYYLKHKINGIIFIGRYISPDV